MRYLWIKFSFLSEPLTHNISPASITFLPDTKYRIRYRMQYRIRCRIRYRMRCRIRYRIRHRIRYCIFSWHHFTAVQWRGGPSVDRVCLPHPVPGSRSQFSCPYTILCHRKPLSQHVQHTLPVTPWLIIYSCVNAVFSAIRLCSTIIVHSCLYVRT